MASALAVVVAGFTVTACGSNPKAGAARAQAQAGCRQMLGVGQAMARRQPASGQAIDHQLHRATSDLDQAAFLDHRWSSLAGSARSFVAALESGTTPPDQLVRQVSSGCQPFAGPG